VFGKGILVADLQHGKKLGEMGLGELGIYSESDLSALFNW
jgi:hypothetical protein